MTTRRVFHQWLCTLVLATCGVSGVGIAPGIAGETGHQAVMAPMRFCLSNGLAVELVPRAHLPIVQVQVVLKAGKACGSAPGLADLTTTLMRRGAGRRDAVQLAETIDGIGANLGTYAHQDEMGAFVSLLKSELRTGVALLADVVQRPALTADEFERCRTEMRAQLKSSIDDPNTVLQLAAQRAIFGGHIYARSMGLKQLAAFTRDDVRAFHRRYVTPHLAHLVVVGDVTPADIQPVLEEQFGQWRGPDTSSPQYGLPDWKPHRVHLVDMNLTQSFIAVGHPAPVRQTPDYPAIKVLNFILGGDFSSRLNQSIRDRQGLAYGAHSAFTLNRFGGMFQATVNTKTASTRVVLESIFSEIERLQTERVGQSELRDAHDYLSGAFPLRFETNADIAREIRSSLLYQLPWPNPHAYQSDIRAVSDTAVLSAAQKRLRADHMQIVVVGPAARIADDLKAFGSVTRYDRHSFID